MLTALGLVSNIIGTVLVGFLTPRYQGVPFGGAMPKALDWRGKVTGPVGWALLVLGFGLQLGGALVHG